jgi:hypothetical protein
MRSKNFDFRASRFRDVVFVMIVEGEDSRDRSSHCVGLDVDVEVMALEKVNGEGWCVESGGVIRLAPAKPDIGFIDILLDGV